MVGSGLDLGARWMRVVSLRPRPLCPREKIPGMRWVRGWVGPTADMLNGIVCRFLSRISSKSQNTCCRYRQKFIYVPKQGTCFTAQNFIELKTTQKIFIFLIYRVLIKFDKHIKNKAKLLLCPQVKCSLHCTDFHEIRDCLISSCKEDPRRISWKFERISRY